MHSTPPKSSDIVTNQSAEHLIECGRPLKELVPLFPTKIASYEFFASSMTWRFASPDPQCVWCGRTCDELPMAFQWRTNVHTKKTVVLSFLLTAIAIFLHHLYSRWMVVGFITFHRLCPSCQRRQRTRRIFTGILHKALFAMLFLLLCLTVPAVVFLAAMPFIAPEATGLMLAVSVIGAGLLTLVFCGFEACRRALIPPSLRQIGRFPFFLQAWHKLDSDTAAELKNSGWVLNVRRSEAASSPDFPLPGA